MTEYIYNVGDNVCYNNACCMIFRKRVKNNLPAYLILELDSKITHDNILESDCVSCTASDIINHFWSQFNYTGDNKSASDFMINCLIKKISSLQGIEFGPNEDNTVYTFSINNGANVWTKNLN